MGTDDAAKRIPLAEAIAFSADARINKEIMTTSGLEIRMNCYEPGQATPMHKHPDEEEVLYIVEGRGRVFFDGRDDLAVSAGELVCLPADQFHGIAAAESSRMVLIYFMKPGYRSVRPAEVPAQARLHGERG